ncbi:MAG: hypothetical protein ACT4P6_15405 [Gemmatimonadaceae bacterium]
MTAALRTLDDAFLSLGAIEPSFAGLFYGADGRPVVLLTDTSRRDFASVGISTVFPRVRSLRDAEVRLAKFTFRQLFAWKDAIIASGRTPSFATLDIDESRNLLRIGVRDTAAVIRTQSALSAAGIPSAATLVEIAAPAYLAADLRNSTFTPPLGGIQVTGKVVVGQSTIFGVCSLGFNVRLGATHYFVTNSHCTSHDQSVGGLNGAEFFQPFATSALIGNEAIDPNFAAGLPACPSNWLCRYADAALIQYVGISPPLGAIAKTQFAGGSSSGSITVVGNFTIVADATDDEIAFYDPELSGQNVNKVGRTTGWTNGLVRSTCELYQVGTDPVTGKPLGLLCQFTAWTAFGAGDSGSPVFMYEGGDPSTSNVLLSGVAHSYSFNEFGYPFFWFSTISGVKNDLGALVTH